MKSTRWLLLWCSLFAACEPKYEAALQIKVEVAPGAAAKFVVVTVDTESTPCLSLARLPVEVGVSQGSMPPIVTVQVTGYADPGCTVPVSPPERVSDDRVRFLSGRIERRTLTLPNGRVEATCANGLDDDEDRLIDCADDDCDRLPCSTGAVCTVNETCSQGTCGSGSPVQCQAAPQCFALAGACAAPNGCTYAPTPGASCDAGDVCLTNETCGLDGACRGAQVSCTTPPGPQCWNALGVCLTGVGCTYQPMTGSSCDDRDACTLTDACDADGGCGGTKVSCAPRACQAWRTCDGAGECVYERLDAGVGCGDAGVCNYQGACLPAFPYPPSNVPLEQVPTFPDGGIVLNCGETTIDTGSGDAGPLIANWCSGQPALGWGVVSQPNGVEALVLSGSGLSVRGGSTLRFVGLRPAILVVNGPVEVLGEVITQAGAQPCTSDGGAPAAGNGGAAGGSHGTQGGNGGDGALLGSTPGLAGPVNGTPTLVPLRGGCPGGAASSSAPALGGGALQISTSQGLTVSGTINAPGQGGLPGTQGIPSSSGAGAGSGGGLLLEALTLTVSGFGSLVANGGGGGSGGSAFEDGTAGAAATRTGGVGGITQPGALGLVGGAGGAGADVSRPAGNGANGVGASGGGGGGGLGRVRLNVVNACSLGPMGAGGIMLSPMPTSNKPDAGCP